MKKIKKVLLVLLFLLMSATALVACEENGNGEEISGPSSSNQLPNPDSSSNNELAPITYSFVKVISSTDSKGSKITASLEEGAMLDLTAPAAAEGKEFKGWFYEDGSPVAPDTKMGREDIVIYAEWKIHTYTVTVKQDKQEDVVYTFGVEACPATETTAKVYDIKTLSSVIKKDYANTEKVEYTISGMPKTWELKDYELTVTKTDYHIVTVDGKANRLQDGATFTLETLEKEGYQFLGWKDADGNDVEEGSIAVTEDLTFLSAWKKLPIEVVLGENAIDISETCNKEGAFEVVQFSGKAGAYEITATNIRVFKLESGEMSNQAITRLVLTKDETASFAVTYGEDLETVGTITVGRLYDPQIKKEAVKVADSALGSTHSTNPLTKYQGTDDTTVAPFGFNGITRFDTATNKAMWVAGYNTKDLSAYEEVWFAIKIVNGTLETKAGAKTTNSWIYFHLTQTADSVWTIEMTIDGEVYETQTKQSGTEYHNTSVQKANSLATILYGNSYQSADGAYVLLNNNSGATMTLYATEIMGYEIPWAPEISKYAEKTLESALGSTHSTNPLTKYEGTDDTTAAPAGFNAITRFETTKNGVMWMAGYNTQDLSAYEQVWFAVKVVNGTLKTNRGEKATNSWIYFHLTQTADSVWTIEMTIDGKVYETQTNQSGTEYQNTSVQKANSLATILYGNGYSSADGAYVFLNNNSGATMTLYSTEVVAELSVAGVPAENAQTVTDENGATVWMLRDGASDDHTHEYKGEDSTAAPRGFTQVKRFDSNTETGADGAAWTTGRAWDTGYDDTVLSAYSEVWFAVKVSSGYLNDRTNTLAASGNWAYFHLTQTADSIWTVEVIVNGEVKATYTGHNGNSTSTTQPKNSIAKIVYNTGGAEQGVYLWVQNGACNIYTTEVVGVLKATPSDTQA